MRIYMDESGNFTAGQLISVVLVLVIPSTNESALFSEISRLTASWTKHDGEIKGSSLDASKAARITPLLAVLKVIAAFCCIDMANHTSADIEDFKERQAKAVVVNLSPSNHPDMIKQLNDTAAAIRRMPNQLFVQAVLTINLVFETVQVATMYYSQRLPKELGDIAWVIDGKAHKPTEMEEIWSLLVVPFAESHFIKTPLIMLVEGDYSDFDHRYKSDSDAELMSHRKWLETTYSIPARSRANPVTDPKLLLTEQLEFTDSKRHVGLQLADMLANIVRRALNIMLLQTGWEDLGKVLVEKKWKDNSWFQRIGNSRGHVLPSNHVVRVAEILKSKAKPMQHQK